ncbi:MAG TPA: polymer-forming cytoskeletal protein [Candidatus Hydrogenedentes bacterium]|nr:polymer-forming cytoskeletal protein [Candidatus Hydrogenedentota bacterium]
MPDLSKKKTYSETKVVTIIGSGTTFTGEIKSQGTIRIEGVVHGHVQSDDTIVVQESGRVKADLVAGQVIIGGQVEGNVFAHDRLEVNASAKLVGDIAAPRISIAEGVLFEGKCTMKAPGELKPPAKAAVPAPSSSGSG